jgi:hypothetical protein
VLLDVRRRNVGLKILDEGGDMERLYRHKFIDACPAPRLFVGTGHVQRRIISWELARELRRDLTRNGWRPSMVDAVLSCSIATRSSINLRSSAGNRTTTGPIHCSGVFRLRPRKVLGPRITLTKGSYSTESNWPRSHETIWRGTRCSCWRTRRRNAGWRSYSSRAGRKNTGVVCSEEHFLTQGTMRQQA